MQVNVFVSEVEQDGTPTAMLVLPFGPEAAIPEHLRKVKWRYFATADADDAIIGLGRRDVESALATDGYVLTTPMAKQRSRLAAAPRSPDH
ncbi:MAG: hypothetical protein ABS76_16255 [Pelagibacterium sp. SCN 64-44]|nr:MAG: hypothetical protein ABS76_16255 [Pelagibacterium sp. SCN 64-44]